MSEWRDIATAPRDGRTIRVWSEGDPPYEMHWNPAGTSWCQRGVGIWEHASGQFTWSEEKGFGPTHWQPLDDVTSAEHGLGQVETGERSNTQSNTSSTATVNTPTAPSTAQTRRV